MIVPLAVASHKHGTHSPSKLSAFLRFQSFENSFSKSLAVVLKSRNWRALIVDAHWREAVINAAGAKMLEFTFVYLIRQLFALNVHECKWLLTRN